MSSEYEKSPMGILENHYENFFGRIDQQIWHSTDVKSAHIDILQFSPTTERPYWTLATSGMSFQPQYVPKDMDISGRTELVMYVSEVKGWMINVMKGLAEMPFDDGTFLYWYHTVPNGKPMTAESSLLTSFFFTPPYFEDPDFSKLTINGEQIDFLVIVPITENERQYAIENGSRALDDLFCEKELEQVINEKRNSLI